jgi:uncharacterized protein (TIGR03083 family)
MTLAYAVYLDTIREEADRLLESAVDGLALSVPTCPEWRVRDLVEHLAAEYEDWCAQVEAADPAARVEPVVSATEVEPLERLETAAVALLQALDAASADRPCWNWSGQDKDAAWVARRMALETAVHRVDVELAQGSPNPVEREVAVDGVNERLDVHLRLDIREFRRVTLGGSLCLICEDDPAAWVVEVEGGRLRTRQGRGPADAALVARASDVFLFTWNRVKGDDLQVTGDRDVVDAWRALPV